MIASFLVAIALTATVPDFSGTWETTYGTLVLNQTGASVSGYYIMGGMCSVEGTVNSSGRLVFEYTEPSATGEGWFELAPDGSSISGEWRATGSTAWAGWEGYRAGAGNPDAKWLVILEAEWQSSMQEPEYSFGDMLEAFFARVEGVTVRHRFIHDRSDLELFALETASLPGSVYLLLSSHADENGISVADGSLGGREIAQALAPCRNLHLLHFSSCLVMNGDMPRTIMQSRRDWPDDFIISGYTESVDWGGSAIIEFFYLDMILENGLTPEEAAQATLGSLTFSSDKPGRWMDPAGFTWLAQ
jgi:hypothetical protein